jgi:hypothetical protein
VFGLHPKKGGGIEERPTRDPQVELPAAFQLVQEPVGHLDDVDVPRVDLPAFGHPDKDLDRVLDNRRCGTGRFAPCSGTFRCLAASGFRIFGECRINRRLFVKPGTVR